MSRRNSATCARCPGTRTDRSIRAAALRAGNWDGYATSADSAPPPTWGERDRRLIRALRRAQSVPVRSECYRRPECPRRVRLSTVQRPGAPTSSARVVEYALAPHQPLQRAPGVGTANILAEPLVALECPARRFACRQAQCDLFGEAIERLLHALTCQSPLGSHPEDQRRRDETCGHEHHQGDGDDEVEQVLHEYLPVWRRGDLKPSAQACPPRASTG